MSKLICIDTNITVWGIKKQAAAGQEEMIDRAEALIKDIASKGHKLCIPVFVLAETLIKVRDEKHRIELSEFISRNSRVAEFGTAAALQFSRLFQEYCLAKDKGEIPEIPPRNLMKVDFMIASIAIVQKASCIYTNDPHLEKFCGHRIECKPLPEIIPAPPHPVQQTLFDAFGLL